MAAGIDSSPQVTLNWISEWIWFESDIWHNTAHSGFVIFCPSPPSSFLSLVSFVHFFVHYSFVALFLLLNFSFLCWFCIFFSLSCEFPVPSSFRHRMLCLTFFLSFFISLPLPHLFLTCPISSPVTSSGLSFPSLFFFPSYSSCPTNSSLFPPWLHFFFPPHLGLVTCWNSADGTFIVIGQTETCLSLIYMHTISRELLANNFITHTRATAAFKAFYSPQEIK